MAQLRFKNGKLLLQQVHNNDPTLALWGVVVASSFYVGIDLNLIRKCDLLRHIVNLPLSFKGRSFHDLWFRVCGP